MAKSKRLFTREFKVAAVKELESDKPIGYVAEGWPLTKTSTLREILSRSIFQNREVVDSSEKSHLGLVLMRILNPLSAESRQSMLMGQPQFF